MSAQGDGGRVLSKAEFERLVIQQLSHTLPDVQPILQAYNRLVDAHGGCPDPIGMWEHLSTAAK